jgi:hypothetical protein
MSRRAGKLLLRARSHGNSPCRPPGQVCTTRTPIANSARTAKGAKKKTSLTIRLDRLELRFPAR